MTCLLIQANKERRVGSQRGDIMIDQDRIDAIARTVHEAMRGWVAAHGERPTPPWSQAPKWMKESSRESVRFAIENPDAPHSAQHDQWMAQKRRDGWTFGQTKDEVKKTHPMLIPYDDLPDFEKRKDALVRAIALGLSEGL